LTETIAQHELIDSATFLTGGAWERERQLWRSRLARQADRTMGGQIYHGPAIQHLALAYVATGQS
jgi:hypothetical protein